jgi:hypothetical protein
MTSTLTEVLSAPQQEAAIATPSVGVIEKLAEWLDSVPDAWAITVTPPPVMLFICDAVSVIGSDCFVTVGSA